VIFWDWVIDALLRRPDQAPARRTNDDRGAHFHPTTAFCKNIQKFDLAAAVASSAVVTCWVIETKWREEQAGPIRSSNPARRCHFLIAVCSWPSVEIWFGHAPAD